MGLFSKLFGNDKDAKSAVELLSGLFNNQQGEQKPQPSDSLPLQQAAQSAPQEAAGPSGFSWGPVMPEEENQFNFGGSYEEYFEGIFRSEFADYELRKDYNRYNRAPFYTFVKDGKIALVVELMSESSNARKLRNECSKALIPYLRYYIDHKGWWNTRQYVITRTRGALLF